MLSDRRQAVLAALIREYVDHAVPVGSRTLTERYRLGVSPATVRNELSVLEDDGLIEQPHTSAGRIPTDYGYRSFVDDLLADNGIGEGVADDTASAIEDLKRNATELDDLLERTGAAMAGFTECLSIVMPPTALSLDIRQITFVALTPYRVMIVLVCDDGQVFNRAVDFGEPIDSDDLASAQRLLNNVFVGKSLADIRDTMDADTIEALQDPLVNILLHESFDALKVGDAGRSHRLGLASLLTQPEFSDSSALVPVLQVLEDDTVLLDLLRDVREDAAGRGPIVRIGHENANEQLSGVSVVASPFGHGDDAGLVAVIGPTRMDYSNVIQAVRAASRALQD